MSELRQLVKFPSFTGLAIIILVSAIEVTGLAIWLGLQTSGFIAISGVVLFSFLFIEHIITQQYHNDGLKLTASEVGQIAGFTFLETLLWVIWLALIPVNAAVAGIFFFITLYFEHQFTNNVKNKLPFFHLDKPGTLLFIGLVVFTFAEFAGAVIWVSQSLLIVMFIASNIEHYIATNVGRIREENKEVG